MAIVKNEHGTFYVSDDLAQGIARCAEQFESAGGVGAVVTLPNVATGEPTTGTLCGDGTQPLVQTSDGKRYRVRLA